MMLFDSKMPMMPSGLNAAGTVPNGCASRKALVFRSFTPLKPVRPICSPAGSDSSATESGLASKSHSQDWSSVGGAPRISISTPHKRAAIVAFHIRGFGRYEKIRSWLMPSSPRLRERPDLDVERPRGPLLLGDVPRLLGDRGRLDEEKVSRRLRSHGSRPFEVDDGVNHDIRDVHAFRSDLASHRLGEDPLRRLGRCKAGELRLPSQRRRVPCDDDGSFPRVDHRGRQSPGQMEKRHRVDLEIPIQHLGLDLEERAEGAAHGIVYQELRRAKLRAHSLDRGIELRFVAHVAGITARVLNLAFEG